MKLVKNILASVKPHFEEGGKLEKMYPAYDAFETFLFVPNHTTHAGSHIRDAIDLMENLGIYEVSPEDLALCEFVCTSKIEVQSIIRHGLDLVRKENN